ncbi:MAG: 16S rRNA (uracil(1498)-N(3))-methyltransferase [Cyclobacteriaceae bacterium]|nr:16S rRNA (uracil(1498)-N(3))-methyltransferase [Cyclobacteriaceae bacterium SS2]
MDDFYLPEILTSPRLAGDEFKHAIRVLRKNPGDQIGVFDGQGQYFLTRIGSIGKDYCDLEILDKKVLPQKPFYTHLVIAPTKSTDRMEWMIEKLAELGIDEVTFIHTQHAERPKIKTDRLEKKAVSAMKQSKSGYLLKVSPLIRFSDFIKSNKQESDRYLATVQDDLPLLQQLATPGKSSTILIGPEGDFSKNEIDVASQHGFKPVSLGKNTLRTETAGLIACHILNVVNNY